MTTPPVLPPVLGAPHLCLNLLWKEVITVAKKQKNVYVGKWVTVHQDGTTKVWPKRPTTKEQYDYARKNNA
jgi:hypothetical protein